jgi:uncharacterized membrane protein
LALAAAAAAIAAIGVACGDSDPRTAPAGRDAGSESPVAGSPIDVRDPWREAEARGLEFRAVGQEPGWYLEIDSRPSLLLVYDYGARRIERAVTRATGPGGEITYRAAESSDVVVTVEPRGCSDVMSGQPFPSAVVVTIAAASATENEPRELRGCGRALGTDAQWTISARGLGPVRIGMTPAAVAGVLGGPLEPATDRGECVYRRSPTVPPGVLFMQVGDRMARIDVTAFDVRTDRGVGVGDSESRVREAYGDAVVSSPHKYTAGGHYLTVAPDADHRLVFETDGMWVTRYRVGRLPEVEWVEGCS